ncbi:hypothetical protein CSC17_3150 [Klebsiella oxytoca]|nr:hypothetical protein CSC17_3150 [Klebsiella oxytoca]
MTLLKVKNSQNHLQIISATHSELTIFKIVIAAVINVGGVL